MRIEKIAYEKLVNRMGGRSRTITRPSRWHYNSKIDQKLLKYNNFHNNFFGRLVFKLIRPFFILECKWMDEVHRQYGTCPHDLEIYADSEIRREIMFQHVLRQSFHPYEYVWRKRKMGRYEKLAHALWGCKVPQSVANENKGYTTRHAVKMGKEYRRFLFENYTVDLTHDLGFFTVPRFFPLEIFAVKGLLSSDTWDRYFFNEVNKNTPPMTQQDYTNLAQKPLGMDLKTPEGRAQYESLLNDLQKAVPGFVVAQGEKINMEQIYAQKGISITAAAPVK